MILIFTDLHLDNYRRFSTTLQGGINSRLYNQIKVIDQVASIANTQKPEAIVFLGDLFNGQGATINKLLYLVGFQLVDRLQQIAPLYLIVGNHDLYGDTHILSPMAEFPNVRLVDETRHFPFFGLDVAMVPWGGSLPPHGDLLLGHLDIEGVKTGLGFELPGTIHAKEVKDFKLVISGHYHSYQTISPNIIYCGAVMPTTFGDIAEEDYGCLLLDADLNPVRHIISSPKFIPIVIDTQEDMNKFVEHKSNNYYRLTVKDRKITVPKFDYTVEVDWDIEEKLTTRLQYEVDAPLEDVLCQYIDQINTRIDKEQAKLILREVMSEC